MNRLEVDSLLAKIVKRWPAISEHDIDDYSQVLAVIDYHEARAALNHFARETDPPFADVFYAHVAPKGNPLMTDSDRQYGLQQLDRLRAIWAERQTS